jgi:tRNA pseudouridine55 synthase
LTENEPKHTESAKPEPEPGSPAAPIKPTPTGLLIVDKPLGMSSMHVCRIVRRRLVNGGYPKRAKVGHGGTLDPLATGVLVILVGKATRLSESVMHGTKRYLTQIDLMHRSETDDYEGALEPIAVDEPPSEDRIKTALASFVGSIEQIPPAYSALKIKGEPAYKRIRRGEKVTMKPRTIVIHSIDIVAYEFPMLTLDVVCGRGTYIRTLARDVGFALETGGVLAGLRRTAVGPFTIEQAAPIDGGVPDPLDASDLLPIDPFINNV